jgi:hypothetical protein
MLGAMLNLRRGTLLRSAGLLCFFELIMAAFYRGGWVGQ